MSPSAQNVKSKLPVSARNTQSHAFVENAFVCTDNGSFNKVKNQPLQEYELEGKSVASSCGNATLVCSGFSPCDKERYTRSENFGEHVGVHLAILFRGEGNSQQTRTRHTNVT